MIDIFPYEKRIDYPHMNIRDKEIWERFIAQYPDSYNACQYDFHVGDAPPFNTLMDDDEDRNQDKLYRLRIDVIGHAGDHRDLIEIKPQAGTAAIGQIKAYKNLYVRDGFHKGTVGMVIVTDALKPNMEYLAKSEGVKVIIV